MFHIFAGANGHTSTPYSSPAYQWWIRSKTFPQWMSETDGSTETYIYIMAFLYTYIPMIRFNL